MAIVKTAARVSKFDGDFSPGMISTDESDDDEGTSGSLDSHDESDPSDLDSGMESDEFDLSELGESNTELCQVGDQCFSIPVEIYDLTDLMSVFSIETWNECLTEEERFGLSEFLPDMDQETLERTLIDMFRGKNFHFGSPACDFFDKLRGGMLDPRVMLYHWGLSVFRKREHYCMLRKYQNSIVGGFVRIRDAWKNCSGYGIEERLRLLNILKSQGGLVCERNGDVASETDSENFGVGYRRALEPVRFGKDNAKGLMKIGPPKVSVKKEYGGGKHDFDKKVKVSKGLVGLPQQGQIKKFDVGSSRKAQYQMRGSDDEDEKGDDVYERHWALDNRANLLKSGKKSTASRGMDHLLPQDNTKSRVSDQGVTIAAYNPHSLETLSNAKYPAKNWMYAADNQVQHRAQKGTQVDRSGGGQPSQPEEVDRQVKVEEWSVKSKMTLQGKFKGNSTYNGGIGATMFTKSDETESDSLEELEEEDGGINPYLNRLGNVRTAYGSQKSGKLTKADEKVHSSAHPLEAEPYSTKRKHKSKTADPSYTEDIILVKKKTQVPQPSGKLQQPWQKSYTADKKRKSESHYMHDYGSSILSENVEYLDGNSQYHDGMQTNIAGNRYQVNDAFTSEADPYGRLHIPLLGCNSVTKKRKGNADFMYQSKTDAYAYAQSSPMRQIDEANFIKKKGKKKVDAAAVPSVVTSDSMIPAQETGNVEPVPVPEPEPEPEPEPKPQKKPFILITPSQHTGFSFSIIHLLSAIRKAMITRHMEDATGIGNLDKGDGQVISTNEENKALQAANGTDQGSAEQNNLPSVTVQEIVNRVRTNPGDPCILETQEPLQDLVRGVLKIFSSKTAPLGAKSWKALVSYEKSNKSWSWVGPVPSSSPENGAIEEETSPEAWGLPHKTLVKLVDSFANWLKSGQEILKQIGSLPPPPIELLPQLDEKERFRDLRAQKSLNTINPSSAEVREYFRKEEQLRYSIPDRAFSYTALDGKKSIVAPLRRGGGKPTSKARDHFMLKPDRPPHITLLCVVRDAAARLPGSIGTRADVCTLIRDSQYIVEDVSDEKVNQVVSGALDRLHYERDPCVQFDVDRKLWVYLHRDREEEDFEDDGTSSTKKWKRPRKEAADQTGTGAGNDTGYPTTEDLPGVGSGRYDLNSDLNVDASSIQEGAENVLIYNDLRSNMENIQPFIDPLSAGRGQTNPVRWEPPGLNPSNENKMLCQENSANEDFDDEAFGRERPVGLLGASLL